MKVWMSIKGKSIGVRGDSRVNRGGDDSCLVHELGKYQSRKAETWYKRQRSVCSADTTLSLKVYFLDVYFSFFGSLIRSRIRIQLV